MPPAPHLLLVEAPYYAHIAALLRQGAERAVAAAGATCETVSVPGAFEIPAAIALAAKGGGRFDGYVALGCVIRGETSHYDHVCAESARGVQDLASRDGLAVGFGILTVENEAQALVRASPVGSDGGGRDKGGDYAPLAEALGRVGRAAILIGEAAEKMQVAFRGTLPVERAPTLEAAVDAARRLARPGDAVVLSPACSSFDMFRDYAHRAEVFRGAVARVTGQGGPP